MSNENISPLRLCVWLPCRWEREYFDITKRHPAEVTSFQECIYSWEPNGDPFSSVTSSEQLQRLREVLENFAPENTPSERGIENLKNALKVMDEILSNTDNSSWGYSEEYGQNANGEQVNLRQHHLLALRQHIQWVSDTFSSVPETNVTIR
jgi:hypothetical protein